jgi:hypothetical protein
VGALMSNHLHKNENEFLEKWDDDKYRLPQMFSQNNKDEE